jgi:nitrite reductase (NADH) large subunit
MTTEEKTWICTVCGYVHTGSEPPGTCVICGATCDLFEPHQEPAKVVPASSQWRCLICEYIATGSTPPEVCPVCGAPADRFEAHAPEAMTNTLGAGGKQTVVIVGGGIAGISAAESVRKGSPEAEIVLISKEADLPYYRLNLTRYLAGEITSEQLPLYTESWYHENKVALRLSTEVRSVNPQEKRLQICGADDIHYDSLILAMGSHPFVPPMPGASRENVTVLRTRRDADFILDHVRTGAQCVIIGGGLLGLETAGALARQGGGVTLVESFGWLLPRQLNQTAALRLEDHVRSLGIQLRKKVTIKEIVGDERVHGVLLDNGETIPADLVVISTGVRSNSYLARLAGLEVDSGIIVSNTLQTSIPDIYAAGDVAEHQGVTYGTWGPSQFQGSIAGLNVAGTPTEFAGLPRSNMLKVLGVDMFSVGCIQPEDGSYQIIEGIDNDNYFYFLFRDCHMAGAVLLGDTSASASAKHAVEQRSDCLPILKGSRSVKAVLDYLG